MTQGFHPDILNAFQMSQDDAYRPIASPTNSRRRSPVIGRDPPLHDNKKFIYNVDRATITFPRTSNEVKHEYPIKRE